ncbi:MAG: family 16 glycoside hydrolase [Blastocatellales bacterium]
MKRYILILSLAALTMTPPTMAQNKKVAAPKPIHISIAKDKIGGESSKFLSIVGDWSVVDDGGKKVYAVDGRQWLRGNPSRGLAEKARAIYGSKHEEFIDNVKAFAYFPISVAREIDNFQNGEISVKFKMIAGQLDKCSGILFNVKPNGDYLAVRFNGKEDNLVLWTFNQGKRKFVKRGTENVPLELNKWYEIKIAVHGTQLEGYLNGQKLLDYTLAEPVSGKVGLWSKTDSVSYFDDFTVIPMVK